MSSPDLYIGSDHAGFEQKERLKAFLDSHWNVEDIGAFKLDPEDDYPDYALKLCEKVKNSNSKGILICGAAHGMNISANKVKGIRATVCWNAQSAELAKKHTNVNVLCIPGRLIQTEDAEKAILAWMNTLPEKEERHLRRIEKIKSIEEGSKLYSLP